jgi:hypothetical protein
VRPPCVAADTSPQWLNLGCVLAGAGISCPPHSSTWARLPLPSVMYAVKESEHLALCPILAFGSTWVACSSRCQVRGGPWLAARQVLYVAYMKKEHLVQPCDSLSQPRESLALSRRAEYSRWPEQVCQPRRFATAKANARTRKALTHHAMRTSRHAHNTTPCTHHATSM